MKLMMSKAYIAELQQKYCAGNDQYIGAYAVMKGIFLNKAFVLFVRPEDIKVVRLGIYTLKVKEDYLIDKKNIDNIQVKKGIIFDDVKIKTSDGKTLKFKIQKNVFGLKQNQQEAFERLSRY